MQIKKIRHFFKRGKNFIDDQCAEDSPFLLKQIASIVRMKDEKKLNLKELSEVLNKLDDFLDEKEFEKAEIIDELQLSYAFQEVLREKRAELMCHKQ